MPFKSFIILLLMAVSFQAMASVSDLHQAHQSGADHLEFEHDHDDAGDLDSQDDLVSYDCHHCCHCHGGHISSILPTAISLGYIESKQSINILEQSVQSYLSYGLLRPPQA